MVEQDKQYYGGEPGFSGRYIPVLIMCRRGKLILYDTQQAEVGSSLIRHEHGRARKCRCALHLCFCTSVDLISFSAGLGWT